MSFHRNTTTSSILPQTFIGAWSFRGSRHWSPGIQGSYLAPRPCLASWFHIFRAWIEPKVCTFSFPSSLFNLSAALSLLLLIYHMLSALPSYQQCLWHLPNWPYMLIIICFICCQSILYFWNRDPWQYIGGGNVLTKKGTRSKASSLTWSSRQFGSAAAQVGLCLGCWGPQSVWREKPVTPSNPWGQHHLTASQSFTTVRRRSAQLRDFPRCYHLADTYRRNWRKTFQP